MVFPPNTESLLHRFADKARSSRFLTVSLGIHLLVILILGGTVIGVVTTEPTDTVGGLEEQILLPTAPDRPAELAPTADVKDLMLQPVVLNPISPVTTPSGPALDLTPRLAPSRTLFSKVNPDALELSEGPNGNTPIGLDQSLLSGLAKSVNSWTSGKDPGPGVGLREREWNFVAFLGRYDGGNWNSTVQMRGNEVERGSLPNLLYFISKASANKIKTNERDVKVIKLDSDELLSTMPPFLFLTGSRDFRLTEKEVENLRKYLTLGGAIWGDSSVPGLRSRFDIAFRREMKRIIPDKDKDFEALPSNHPIFTDTYFRDVKAVPAGLNYYREPVWALKMFGEVSIIYTSNDYGDMWQVALTPDGKVDLGRDRRGSLVVTNEAIWDNRNVYLNNLNEESLLESYRFGVNVIVHLLTRWENTIKAAPRL